MARYVNSSTAAEIISEYTNIPLYKLVDIMTEVPSEDVAPVRHGEWEYQPPTATLNGAWKCTACKCYFWEHTANEFKYCPNCGAKMDKES